MNKEDKPAMTAVDSKNQVLKDEDKDFINSLQIKKTDFHKILNKLYLGVIQTNKMIGMDRYKMSTEERLNLIETYKKLCYEEGKELKIAIEQQDKVEVLDAVVDFLVVGGFLYFLEEDLSPDTQVERGVDLSTDITGFFDFFELERYGECVYWAQDIFTQLDINHEMAVDTVIKSNLSKFPTFTELKKGLISSQGVDGVDFYYVVDIQDEEAIDYQIKQIEDKGRYSGVHCKKVLDSNGEERLTFWSTHEYGEEKHKYLKPCTFLEPNFRGCWFAKDK